VKLLLAASDPSGGGGGSTGFFLQFKAGSKNMRANKYTKYFVIETIFWAVLPLKTHSYRNES